MPGFELHPRPAAPSRPGAGSGSDPKPQLQAAKRRWPLWQLGLIWLKSLCGALRGVSISESYPRSNDLRPHVGTSRGFTAQRKPQWTQINAKCQVLPIVQT